MNAAEFQGDYNRERIDALRPILFSSIKYRFRHSGHLPGYSARYVLPTYAYMHIRITAGCVDNLSKIDPRIRHSKHRLS